MDESVQTSNIKHQSSSIKRFPDPEALAWAFVDYFANLVHPYDRFCVAMSGGNTPKRAYNLLDTREDIEWHKIHLFLGDERWVPPSDERSNEKMIKDGLVRQIDIPLENVHWMYDEDGPEESARMYNQVLHRFFDERDYTFDLAIQGMGEDGHTASVFPGSGREEGGEEGGEHGGKDAGYPAPGTRHLARWVIATQGTTEAPERVSCTLDCLAASREVIFFVTGGGKAERLKQVLGGDLSYPAAVLASKAQNVQWWIDEAAGSRL